MKHTGAFYERVFVCLRVYTCIYAIDFCHGLIYLAAAMEYQIHSMTLTTKFIAFDVLVLNTCACYCMLMCNANSLDTLAEWWIWDPFNKSHEHSIVFIHIWNASKQWKDTKWIHQVVSAFNQNTSHISLEREYFSTQKNKQ